MCFRVREVLFARQAIFVSLREFDLSSLRRNKSQIFDQAQNLPYLRDARIRDIAKCSFMIILEVDVLRSRSYVPYPYRARELRNWALRTYFAQSGFLRIGIYVRVGGG
jgi:hypothetical protein